MTLIIQVKYVLAFPALFKVTLLGPEGCGNNFRCEIFKLSLWIDIFNTSCKIGLRWVPQDSIDDTDDKSTLVQVRAWCLMAPSPYLNQCWPIFMLPDGVIRRQWVQESYGACKYISMLLPNNWPQTGMGIINVRNMFQANVDLHTTKTNYMPSQDHIFFHHFCTLSVRPVKLQMINQILTTSENV